jgi:hypothetical protein
MPSLGKKLIFSFTNFICNLKKVIQPTGHVRFCSGFFFLIILHPFPTNLQPMNEKKRFYLLKEGRIPSKMIICYKSVFNFYFSKLERRIKIKY